MVCDPYWNTNKTVLLAHCEGANGSTTLTDSSTFGRTSTAVGNAQITTALYKYGSACAAFDGSGDYFTFPNSTDWNFGSGDYTVELFAKWTTLPSSGNYGGLIGRFDTTGNNRCWFLYSYNTAGTYSIGFETHSAGTASPYVLCSTNTTITTGVWYHIAACRYGSTIRLFIDGVQVATTGAGDVYSGSIPLYVGVIGPNYTSPGSINGYIDNIRITKGLARYKTAQFTVPTEAYPASQCTVSGTVQDSSGAYISRIVKVFDRESGVVVGAALSDAGTGAYAISVATDKDVFVIEHDTATGDPYWDKVPLAMHMDGEDNGTDFPCAAGPAITLFGNVCTKTGIKKFGTASAYFDGTGDYLTIPADSIEFRTGDFTIECFVYYTSDPNPGGKLTFQFATASGPSTSITTTLAVGADATSKWIIYGGGGQTNAASGYPAINTWYHIALVRNNSVLKLYVDGVETISKADALDYVNGSAIIGGGYSTSYLITGYIDDLRITKGVARYTANFTTPTAAFVGGVSGGTENAQVFDLVTPV